MGLNVVVELVVVGFVVVVAAGFESSGAPTAISQRWPGWPCAGFSLDELPPAGSVVEVVAGAEFKGAPSAISHLCPGKPCLGFKAVFPANTVPTGADEPVAGVVLNALANFAAFSADTVVAGSGAPSGISQR